MKEKLTQIVSIFICLSSFTAQSTAGEMHRELSSSRNNSREVKSKESKETKSRENFSDKSICKTINEVAKADKRIDENLGWSATKLDKQSSTVLQEAFCAIFYGENKETREKRTGGNKLNQIELPSKASVAPSRFKVVENNKSMLQSLREISASRENESVKAPAYFPPPPPPNYVPDGNEDLNEAPPLPIGK